MKLRTSLGGGVALILLRFFDWEIDAAKGFHKIFSNIFFALSHLLLLGFLTVAPWETIDLRCSPRLRRRLWQRNPCELSTLTNLPFRLSTCWLWPHHPFRSLRYLLFSIRTLVSALDAARLWPKKLGACKMARTTVIIFHNL